MVIQYSASDAGHSRLATNPMSPQFKIKGTTGLLNSCEPDRPMSIVNPTSTQNTGAASSPTQIPMGNIKQGFTTNELAELLGLKANSIRKRYSICGSYFGLVPVRFLNRRLLWPLNALEILAGGK